jgi:GAF domain
VKRSGKASGKRSKALPRSPAKLKRGNAPVVRQRGAGATDLRQKLHARQLREMQEQQVATSEVLRAISNSRGDLEPVFQAMLRNATRICAAKFGILFRFHYGLFHPASLLGVPPPFADALDRQGPFPPVPGRLFGRLSKTKKVVHILDRATEAIVSPAVRYGGARSSIGVPLLKNNELVGAFFIYRTKVQPFTQRQIELVQTFADQAVIAIDNARLLNELRQRTTDLTESLDYQTATSSVLGAIPSRRRTSGRFSTRSWRARRASATRLLVRSRVLTADCFISLLSTRCRPRRRQPTTRSFRGPPIAVSSWVAPSLMANLCT